VKLVYFALLIGQERYFIAFDYLDLVLVLTKLSSTFPQQVKHVSFKI